MTKEHAGFRVEQALLDRLDAITTELSRRSSGVELKRSGVARTALERGILSLEHELGIKPVAASSKGAKPARKPSK